jgi:hypothetical protein
MAAIDGLEIMHAAASYWGRKLLLLFTAVLSADSNEQVSLVEGMC